MATVGGDGDNANMETNQPNVETFFELEESQAVIRELKCCGCCSRCILRLIGVKRQSSYIDPLEVLSQLLKSKENGSSPSQEAEDGSAEPDGEPNASSHQPAGGLPSVTSGVCSVCLGILQGPCEKSHVLDLAEQVREADFGFENFTMSMVLPLQLLIREHCIFLHLKSMFSELYQKSSHGMIATIKEVYKWVCGPVMGDALDVSFYFKSPMEIMVTFTHQETEEELNKLLRRSKDNQPQRKRAKFFNAAANAPGRPVVISTIKDLPNSLFKELFSCPPSIPRSPCTTEVACWYSAVFVAGRYNKYSRKLSQTPWLIDGERKTESSIQEIVCDPLKELFKASEFRFSASGREDVDVRTLGNGRPFVVEILNSRRPIPSQAELTALQKRINKSTPDVRIRDLQCIGREDTNKLKDGEEIKTKSYSALVWSSPEQTAESLAFLSDQKDLVLHQKTPIRVLHRRALATRERIVHSMSATVKDAHHFRLFLKTQAGTYIKEFIHGDFGRTKPSLGSLLKCEVDILELDVESVDLDWPPSLSEPEDSDEDNSEQAKEVDRET
ncbi:putative tRNA pseudouridine synthase Pus10 [Acanthaster planci]|uniref:tRNA pseudouridine(55) synthase n=1 Tax=Acanthaster planci TaxID=133434 RepID=A0A8B7XYP6_ACAPL|nr:putative tRNA pseudouridine synthase Pus10 [Acanthaster planci]